jgi:hypothetical protein
MESTGREELARLLECYHGRTVHRREIEERTRKHLLRQAVYERL